ncbi:MAG: ferrous iron transporter B, partial [Candidatus Sumerlaeota bacterium]|nr:ferrous iron transporter B [Candidatus Sumerlaeota bacterium]
MKNSLLRRPRPTSTPSALSIPHTPSASLPRSASPLLVALAGNPNSGKSTLFTRLTGARQTVANYPGVTVEKRAGAASFEGRTLELVDLPGTYSLSADSLDEQVARDFILQSRPAAVVAVLDASNLERNLYLAVQLLELGAPLVAALNMSDVAERRGIHIDAGRLGEALDCPAIPTVASRGRGVEELLRAAVEVADERREWTPPDLSYGEPVDAQLARLAGLFESRPLSGASAPARWVALKCLEQDPSFLELARRDGRAGHDALRIISESVARVRREGRFAAPAEQIAEARYERIHRICGEAVRRDDEERPTWSDAIDRVAVHPLAGPLMMMAVLYAAYWFTFRLSKSELLRWIGIPGSPIDWMEALFAALGSAAARAIPAGPLQSL